MGWSNVGAVVLTATQVILVDNSGNVVGTLDGTNGLSFTVGAQLAIRPNGSIVWGLAGATEFIETISDAAGHLFPALVLQSGTLGGHASNLMAVYGQSSDGTTPGGVVAADRFAGNDPNFLGPQGFAPDPWHTLILQHGWATGAPTYNDPSYRVNALGAIEFKGLCTGGTHTTGTVVATLPAGYRPAATVQINGSGDGTISPFTVVLHVAPNGDITIFESTSTAAVIGFDGTFFYPT